MTSRRPENNKFSLKSIVSDKLTNKEIKEICLLKDKQWKFGIKSQLKWFKNNIKKYDLHNLFYIKSKLVGYTLLRKRTYEIKDLTKKGLKFNRGKFKEYNKDYAKWKTKHVGSNIVDLMLSGRMMMERRNRTVHAQVCTPATPAE